MVVSGRRKFEDLEQWEHITIISVEQNWYVFVDELQFGLSSTTSIFWSQSEFCYDRTRHKLVGNGSLSGTVTRGLFY